MSNERRAAELEQEAMKIWESHPNWHSQVGRGLALTLIVDGMKRTETRLLSLLTEMLNAYETLHVVSRETWDKVRAEVNPDA